MIVSDFKVIKNLPGTYKPGNLGLKIPSLIFYNGPHLYEFLVDWLECGVNVYLESETKVFIKYIKR